MVAALNNKFGVPCSKLSFLIEDVDVYCTSEEEAFGVAFGAILAGETPVLYMQDTGFCRCLNVALSLFKTYEVNYPYLLLSIRTNPPHHLSVSSVVKQFLDTIGYLNVKFIMETST
jgi:sulfopyruvate decarboxylase TPP-binding subunit